MPQPIVPRDRSNHLWARAAAELSDHDKRNINFNRPDKRNILVELLAATEKSLQRSVESRWKYTRKNGETVIIRDLFAKIIRWIDMFKQIGDIAVQYDPAHASLPWAGIRFVLQIVVNDISKHASVVEDLAQIAELVYRFALIEELYLQGASKATKELEKAVVKLYASVLGFLSKAKQYLKQGTIERTVKSALLTAMDLGSGMEEIQTAENDVSRCMVLVDKTEDNENHRKLVELTRLNKPLQRMDDELKHIHDNLQASKRTEIVRWLSPEPYIQHHKQTLQGVLTGTGQWLLSDPIFKKWKDDSASSILWLHGIPGSGKSKLVSLVIEDARARYKAGHSPQPVFFYCSRNPAEPARSDPQAILASLARQLSYLEPGKPLLRPTVKLFKDKEEEGFASGLLQISESLSLILQLMEHYPLVTVVIDAMDECNPDKRDELLEALEQMLQNSSSLVKIFVSSRNDQDIVLSLRHYPNLEIDSRRNGDDIARFVNNQTQQLVQDRKLLQYSTSKAEMKKLIIDKVIEGASGMFRWASMQLQYLCKFRLDEDIKSSLGRLPPDLYGLYVDLYDTISGEPGEHRAAIFKNVLHWLLCARRSLKTEEFLCAVSIDPQSGRSEILVTKDLVLEICNNFVLFDSQLETFRFAHLSVREFLEQRPEYSDSTTNALAAEVCLWTVLSIGANLAAEKLLLELNWHANRSKSDFKILERYADIYWPEHCKLAKKERHCGRLRTALHHVLSGIGGTDSSITLWNKRLQKHLEGYEYWNTRMALEDTVPDVDTGASVGLLVSCAFDFGEVIEVAAENTVQMLQCINRRGYTLVHVATRNGSCASLASLFKNGLKGMEVTQEVVVAAAGNSRSGKEVMALLLDKRESDVHITQEVIVAAARSSGRETMALLLDKRGSDVHITQEVVVAAAGNYGNGKQVMALLLDKRESDVHITQEVVVAAARSSGRETMVLLLDKRGADVRITQEVVVAAARNLYSGKEVMALLLDKRGADVHITQEVVIAAARNSSRETMALLLDKRGADVHITQEVVVAAAGNEYSSKEIFTLLNEVTHLHITDQAIEAAANSGQEDVLRFFEASTDVVYDTTKWLNVARLYNTSKNGDVAVLRCLINEGVPFDNQNINGVTPLWRAAAHGHKDIVELLLATNSVNVNVRSISGRTPIFWASANGHSDIVQLLLEHGAKHNYTDKDGKSPLSIARSYLQSEVVEILVRDSAKVPVSRSMDE